ncbi:toll-like receptor 6 isoform X2 [Amphibalanus amphitrite]|uniref:toll-like receptor 6 isoform X2 n=1 Tax=Amphibalanus amphitrite TaxID=1232801 RepID=UPI001C918B7C|nr:toll-like receptor 6 isoform X2 [Amphibalanus amphitrite]
MMRVLCALVVLLTGAGAAAGVCRESGDDGLRCTVDRLDGARVNATRPAAVRTLELTCSDRLYLHRTLDLEFLRGFRELSSLSIVGCILESVGVGAFRRLRSLTRLTVRTLSTDWTATELRLEPGSFSGAEQLEALDLSDNNLHFLERDVFARLTELRSLNLTNNGLRDVSDLQVAGITDGLQTLDVSENRLLELPPAALSFLPQLRELRLRANELSLIHDGALRGLPQLRLLDVSDNQLVALPAMMLNETRVVSDLRLQNNSIRVLPPGLLADLPELLAVNLSLNALSSLWVRGDAFSGLRRLIVLDLAGNRLETLSREVFADLSSLQVLDLSRNQLQSLPGGLFGALSNLHSLALGGNIIARLEPRSLEGLHVLSRLGLGDNRLTHVDTAAFANSSGLQELELQGNQLLAVPEALGRLTLLRRLDLGDNFLSDVAPQSLAELRQLSYLRLAGNQLRNVSAQLLAGQAALTMLDLSRNQIASIESGAFDVASGLRAIRLDANQLRNVNGLLAKLPQLLWLNASDNHIEFFDYALLPLELRWLDLHRNHLKEIGNFYNIESKIKLETLDLSFNQVTHISRASVPDSIKYFILASNRLTTVEPGTFESKRQLIRADLSSNQLGELDLKAVTLPGGETPSPVAEDGEQEAELLLAGNPFFCDCEMDWLHTINTVLPRRKYPKVLDLDRVMCRLLHMPNSLTPLRNTKPSDFLCTYERHCFPICHCCNYVACDCEMKCPSGCTCYHDHTWNTNIVDCSRREQVTISREIPMDATAVFADGNNIRSLDSHTFIGRKRINALFVNGSNVEEIQNRSLNGLSALQVLRLENNLISELHTYEFESLHSLRELYLHNNRLRTIHPAAFSKLRSLEVLTLRDNQLATFAVWQLEANPYLVELSLADNPWSCECTFMSRLSAFVSDNSAKVEDADSVSCAGDDAKSECALELATAAVARREGPEALPLALSVAGGLALAALAGCLLLRYRAVLCARKRGSAESTTGGSSACTETTGVSVVTPEADKLYDVFVTYSAQDTRFVNEVLAPVLEQSTPSLRLCLLRRDAPNTSYLGDAVHHCVQASRKTLLVVSRNFLDNEWCRFDFKASHLEALRACRGAVVLLHGVDRSAVEGELKTLLKTAPSVTYGEPDFWRVLRGLLPACRGFKSIPRSVSDQSYMMRAFYDKGLLQTMLPRDSPTPTCSTLVSDYQHGTAPAHVRAGSARVLGSAPERGAHNTSYSSLQPSEHTYMTIEQYGSSASGRLAGSGGSELYSSLEPEPTPQLPSDSAHPANRDRLRDRRGEHRDRVQEYRERLQEHRERLQEHRNRAQEHRDRAPENRDRHPDHREVHPDQREGHREHREGQRAHREGHRDRFSERRSEPDGLPDSRDNGGFVPDGREEQPDQAEPGDPAVEEHCHQRSLSHSLWV